jgi:hypothetical protein
MPLFLLLGLVEWSARIASLSCTTHGKQTRAHYLDTLNRPKPRATIGQIRSSHCDEPAPHRTRRTPRGQALGLRQDAGLCSFMKPRPLHSPDQPPPNPVPVCNPRRGVRFSLHHSPDVSVTHTLSTHLLICGKNPALKVTKGSQGSWVP